MKKIFTVLALFVSTLSFAQQDISAINIDQSGFKSLYSIGDTIVIYFTNISSATDKDSTLIQWNTTTGTYYYRINLGASINPIPNGYTYVTKFIVHKDFLSGSKIRVGVASTPKINTDDISAVVSPLEIEKKDIPLSIYSISGQFIKNSTSLSYKESLQPGVYLFLSTNERVVYSGKFIIE